MTDTERNALLARLDAYPRSCTTYREADALMREAAAALRAEMAEAADLRRQLREQTERAEALRAACEAHINKGHHYECPIIRRWPCHECDCGLDLARAAVEALVKEG